MFTSRSTALALVLGTLSMVALDASAASIRVTCEARPGRAKVSVDAKGLAAGSYTTAIVSGGNTATSAVEAAVAGEVETDYDSNAADIRAGATAIVPTFITGANLTGKVLDAKGNTVASDTVACRIRSK